ncbi:hypothetical protein PFISCL1PPCAC_12694, partial [Pristionchus fissidentatus]
TALCPNAYCILYWTRGVLVPCVWFLPPLFDYDGSLHMKTTHWDGVRVRVYRPRKNATESDGAIIYIHGGGFVLGNTEMFEPLTRLMAREMNTRLLVSIDYRLSPETFFPSALEDCEKVLNYVFTHGPSIYGIDPKKIVVMGDSAGGNLAAALSQRRTASKAEPALLGQVLLYPYLQLSDLQTYSYRQYKRELDGLAFVGAAGIDVYAHPEYARAALTNGHVNEEARRLRDELMDYSELPFEFRNDVNGTDLPLPVEPNEALMAEIGPILVNPDFAPLMRRDLSNLPSALVVTCEYDFLRDDGAVYAQRLKKAGVPTRWSHYKNGVHGMLNFPDFLQITQ